MVSKTTNQLFWGHVEVLVDATGTWPTTPVGYITEAGGVSIEGSRDLAGYRVAELDGDAIMKTVKRGMKVSLKLAQFDPALVAKALGLTEDGYVITSGNGVSSDPELALRLVGTRHDGTPLHLYIPRCVSSGSMKIDFSKGAASDIPLEFTALDGTSGLFQFDFGRPSADLTISTGTVARVNAAAGVNGIAWHKLSGEGAAADTLTDITGTTPALAQNEIVRLQIKAITMPITIDHASGIIELTGAADWAMTKLADWLDLYYDLATTTWKEIARYDAP